MASAQVDQVMRTKIDTACITAEAFTKLYYESVDKKRHQMARLYMDNGLLAWNGNGANGKDEIQKYFQELPRSEHNITTLDSQPIVDDAVSSQLTFLIQVSGTVRFGDTPMKPFQQTFMITAQGDKWKIVSDCFRLQDGIF
uniref:NTF2-related export protein n=1 Tax=Anopheles atroparvus TaxID=41427 RepID=A0A182JE74_ANOAO